MTRNVWEEIRLAPGREGHIWEWFHENSKTGRFDHISSEATIVAKMKIMHQSLLFDTYPVVELPNDRARLDMPLGRALLTRRSARSLVGGTMSLAELASILYHSYGITRDNKDTNYPRPFRAAPSGGALYPLEIFSMLPR